MAVPGTQIIVFYGDVVRFIRTTQWMRKSAKLPLSRALERELLSQLASAQSFPRNIHTPNLFRYVEPSNWPETNVGTHSVAAERAGKS
jgi:hypothetical protein